MIVCIYVDLRAMTRMSIVVRTCGIACVNVHNAYDADDVCECTGNIRTDPYGSRFTVVGGMEMDSLFVYR